MKNRPKCAVTGCSQDATVEVILYDVYPVEQSVFFEQDFTCPYLCNGHMAQNEAGAKGVRKPRGSVEYPFSNKEWAQGFTIYRPLDSQPEPPSANGWGKPKHTGNWS